MSMTIRHLIRFLLSATGLMISAHAVAVSNATPQPTQTTPAPAITQAVSVLSPTQGNSVKGTVTFTQVSGGVKIAADVTGLKPGLHGFHIHEFGDCTAPDGNSTGGHFNPYHLSHDGPNSTMRHVGDLGNISADASGKAHYERIDKMITFAGPASIIGRGMIIHEKADDLKSQPAGAAGARVACGAILLVSLKNLRACSNHLSPCGRGRRA